MPRRSLASGLPGRVQFAELDQIKVGIAQVNRTNRAWTGVWSPEKAATTTAWLIERGHVVLLDDDFVTRNECRCQRDLGEIKCDPPLPPLNFVALYRLGRWVGVSQDIGAMAQRLSDFSKLLIAG